MQTGNGNIRHIGLQCRCKNSHEIIYPCGISTLFPESPKVPIVGVLAWPLLGLVLTASVRFLSPIYICVFFNQKNLNIHCGNFSCQKMRWPGLQRACVKFRITLLLPPTWMASLHNGYIL